MRHSGCLRVALATEGAALGHVCIHGHAGGRASFRPRHNPTSLPSFFDSTQPPITAPRDAGALPLSEEAELALAVELSLQTSLLVRCTEPEPEDERGASPPTSPVAQRSAAQHAYKEEAAVRAVVGSGEGAAGSPPPPPKQEHVEDGPGSAGPQQAS